MDYLRSDCILREILEDRKSLTGFLDAIFGFMRRNTDFYHIQTSKDDKLGFPRGVKEQILISCMQKYEVSLEQLKLIKNISVEHPVLVANEIEIETQECSQDYQPILEDVNKKFNSEPFDNINENNCFANTLKFTESEYKNGSVYDSYCWSQTLKDIELCVLLPARVKSAKHIKVDLKCNYIAIKTLLPSQQILINAETWDKYRHNDVIWSISEGKLILSCDKLKECWWDKLFLNETSINIKNVNSERAISEYSPDVQNIIEKLHIPKDQRESLKTLPLNESEQMLRLRQAWHADGSPFKGQTFDPSIIQFN